MTGIRLTDVSIELDGQQIISAFDLDVAAGSMVGLVGPNGAGKTTVLRAIAGSLPVRGTIELGALQDGGKDRAAWARRVALVPQRPELPDDMRVVDYVMLGRTPHVRYLAMEKASDHASVADAMRSLDLLELAGRPLGALSGGEQQRAVLARSLAQAAPVLLLDEPTAALDVGHAQQVLDLVDEIRRSCGLTVVAALHDLTLAAQFCDRLVMISGGRVVAEGAPRTVLTESIIRTHYGAEVKVLEDGDGGVVVIPVRDSRRAPGAASMAEHS
jgi:iron complex transport system ATP-binding protein